MTADGFDLYSFLAYSQSGMRGREFRKLRLAIGLSQSQLARELDLYVRTISKYENNDLVISKVTELALRYLAEHKKGKR